MRAPEFIPVEEGVAFGRPHKLAVLEMAGRPGWWRVWVDGQAVTDPVRMRGSSGRWAPIATAESWNAGTPACNAFGFRFERVSVSYGGGGSWRPFVPGSPIPRRSERAARPRLGALPSRGSTDARSRARPSCRTRSSLRHLGDPSWKPSASGNAGPNTPWLRTVAAAYRKAARSQAVTVSVGDSHLGTLYLDRGDLEGSGRETHHGGPRMSQARMRAPRR